MLNNPSIFFITVWCYLPSLVVPGHTVPPAVITHTIMSIHTLGLAHRHTCLCPSHMCPNYTDPQVPMVPTPGVSPTPLPSPTPALKLPFTFPTTPTFISAHRQAPTCSRSLSSPFHTQARLLLPLDLTHLHSSAHTVTLRRLLYRVSLYLDHKTCVHTPNNPRACLVP